MSTSTPRICLTMIVKDEAHIIGRTLSSVRDLFDSWVVIDTGSTDETISEVKKALEGMPGRLLEADWHGFGKARTLALNTARCMLSSTGHDVKKWYALTLDADEIITREEKMVPLREQLLPSSDSYKIMIRLNNISYPQVRLFRLDRPWVYMGVRHEFPTTVGAWTCEMTAGIYLGTKHEGARSKDPKKFANDAEIIKKELQSEQDAALRARYMFYLGQSYRDAGMSKEAAEAYLRRADMGNGYNWEEIYMALVEAGRALNRLGEGDKALKTFLRAYDTWPARLEATRELAAIFQHRVNTSPRQGSLFVES